MRPCPCALVLGGGLALVLWKKHQEHGALGALDPALIASLIQAGTAVTSTGIQVGVSLAQDAAARRQAAALARQDAAAAASQAKLLEAQSRASEAEARRYAAMKQSSGVPAPLIGIMVAGIGVAIVFAVNASRTRTGDRHVHVR